MCVYLRSRLLHGSTTSITSRTYDDVPEISRDCLSQTILNACTSDKYDSLWADTCLQNMVFVGRKIHTTN